ncbi:unnamed protein product [Brassicogethes aeneus]|uniref:Uncharacterized protein n=1 Tax=Brassicogethes aeneus TaxID=1431903 RepID=A0A9P0B8L8_BRAAE|nr:unnamed protein product [Brassicogethes aeneus]
MDRDDDDDGVGYVRESHYLKSPTVAEQQAMSLLNIPGRDGREGSISSNVSDLDVPIYSSENLTTSSRKPVKGARQQTEKDTGSKIMDLPKNIDQTYHKLKKFLNKVSKL